MSGTYPVTVDIDVTNQTVTASDNSVTVPTSNFDIVTFDGKSCIRANSSSYATFVFGENIESFTCKIFLQSVADFTLFVEVDSANNTKYSLVYYPYGTWWNPDRAVFDSNNVLIGIWVTVTYSNSNKTLTFDNGSTQLTRSLDDYLVDLSIASFANRYNVYLTDFSFAVTIPRSKYVNSSGVSEMWLNIKNWVTSQLLGKQETLISGSNIKTVNNQSLLGSGNVTFTPPTFTYDSSTETLTVSNAIATVFNYDSNTETLEIQVNG